MYHRLCKPLLTQSFFLFGPRGSGKTTFLRQLFQNRPLLWIDLLKEEEVIQFTNRPTTLEERLRASQITLQNSPFWVIIDEVEKIPSLLNEVHRVIESPEWNQKSKFVLTGSSARKLKHGAANLLAGRAFVNALHPLTCREMGTDFDLSQVLHWGSLPKILSFSEPLENREFLMAYVSTYLKEEIREEQIVRRIEPFRKFLEVAAQSNGQILNDSKIARDIGSDPKAVGRYFEILVDTLLGFFLEPYHQSIRKRQSNKSKFYFFDLGIKRALSLALNIPLQPQTYEYGKAFEHFIILECIRLNDYLRTDFRFSYLKTKDDAEIDLVVERPGKTTALIEIKSATSVDEVAIRKLSVLAQDFQNAEAFVFCNETVSRRLRDVTIMPWREGIENLFPSSL